MARQAFQQNPEGMGSQFGRAASVDYQSTGSLRHQRRGSLQEDDDDDEEDLHVMHHRPFKNFLEEAKAGGATVQKWALCPKACPLRCV